MLKRFLLVTASAGILLAGCKEKISPAEAASHLQAAQKLYADKDYAKALVEVQTAIRGNPLGGDGHFLAGQIHEAMGDGKDAIAEYARAASPEANNITAQLKFERILIDANQLDTAIGRINGTLGSRPNDPDALALRAIAFLRQGNADRARADAQAALQRVPGQADATAVLAGDALATKNADKAMTILAAGLKAHPDNPVLLRLKAAALLMQDKRNEAAAIFTDLVAAQPANVGLRAGLAEIDASGGAVDAGEKVLRDGVAAAPAGRDARLALVAYLAKYRGDAAADAELVAAIKDNPQDSAYDVIRADQQTRAQQPEEAVKTLEAAVARVPAGDARVAAQLALARLFVAQGDRSGARKQVEDVLAAKPNSDDALMLRADLMIQANDAVHAVPDLLAVAGRNPRSAAPLQLLGEAYLAENDNDKAAEALKKVVYFDPTNIKPVARLVQLDLKMNKPEDAKRALADFVTRNPDSLDGHIAQARFALAQKDWAAAQAAIDAARRAPKSERAMAFLTGELNEAKGTPANAVAIYARLNDATKPLDREALVGYARASVAAKQADQAVDTITALAAQKTGADAAAADLILAVLFHNLHQTDKAEAAMAAAKTADPTQPAPYLDAASADSSAQPDKAVATLNEGIKAGAPAGPLLMARAAIEERTGQKDAAIATYKAALKADPHSVIAANNYASLVADAKPTDKPLLEDARQPIERFADGSNPAILDTLAWLDYRLGDFQSAKALLVKAKADASPNPQLRFHYGAVLIALGDKDVGRSMLKSALNEAFPGHAEAEQLLTQ